MYKPELFEGISEELKAKIAKCHSRNELEELIKEENVTLNEEQLDAVSGGGCTPCSWECLTEGCPSYDDSNCGILEL